VRAKTCLKLITKTRKYENTKKKLKKVFTTENSETTEKSRKKFDELVKSHSKHALIARLRPFSSYFPVNNAFLF